MKSALRILLAAVMVLGSSPAPRLWADETDAKKLSAVLTSQEKSLYIALRKAGDKSFNAEDLVKPAAPALLAAWRTSLKARAEAYLKADPAPAALKGKPASEQITPFEKTYVAGRMEAAGLTGDQPFLDLLALADKGEKADTLIRNIRNLIRKDLDAYVKKPGETNDNEVLQAWAKTALGGTADLAKANEAAVAAFKGEQPSPPPTQEAPKKDALQTAIAALFDNQVEAAVIEHVARNLGVAEWTRKLTEAAAKDAAEKQQVVDALRTHVRHSLQEHFRTDGKPATEVIQGLGATLRRLNIPNADTLGYFCNWAFPDGTAKVAEKTAGAQPSPKKQLRLWTDKTLWAAGTGRDEDVKAGAAFVLMANDSLVAKCSKYYNDAKFQAAAMHFPDSQPQHRPNVANEGPPSPYPFPAAEDKKAEQPEEKGEIPWRAISIGASAGALALGILGMLFAGPFGALIGAAMGGLFYGGVIAMHHGVI